MSISLQCPSCRKNLKVKDEFAGKRIKCPGCGTVVAVPRGQAVGEEVAKTEEEVVPQERPRAAAPALTRVPRRPEAFAVIAACFSCLAPALAVLGPGRMVLGTRDGAVLGLRLAVALAGFGLVAGCASLWSLCRDSQWRYIGLAAAGAVASLVVGLGAALLLAMPNFRMMP